MTLPTLRTLTKVLATDWIGDFLATLDALPPEILIPHSYRHPNGFDKICLSERQGSRVVVHAWLDPRPDPGDIHDHRWSFSSALVAGSLAYESYEESALGEAFQVNRYASPSGGSAFGLVRDGVTRIRCTARGDLVNGTVYQQPFDILHRVAPAGPDPVVTVVVHLQSRDSPWIDRPFTK